MNISKSCNRIESRETFWGRNLAPWPNLTVCAGHCDVVFSTRQYRAMLKKVRASEFMRAYVDAILWTGNDESDENGGKPLDDAGYKLEDFDRETLASIIRDCETFQAAHAEDLAERGDAQAGHDFWMTRDESGVGFDDGDWSEEVGERLAAAADTYGRFWITVGDDGKIYGYAG